MRASFTGSTSCKSCTRRLLARTQLRKGLCVNAATVVPKEYASVKPVGERVFIKLDEEESRTSGGLLLPSAARKKPTAGSVTATGADAKMLKVGEKVVYGRFSGTEISIQGEEHVLVKEEDIIGVLPTPDKIAEMRPLGDRVLIKCAEQESKSAGGVLLDAASGDKPTFGTVVAVGDGLPKEEGSEELVKPNVPVGGTVMYSKYSGTEFEDTDGTEYIVVREADILACLS